MFGQGFDSPQLHKKALDYQGLFLLIEEPSAGKPNTTAI